MESDETDGGEFLFCPISYCFFKKQTNNFKNKNSLELKELGRQHL